MAPLLRVSGLQTHYSSFGGSRVLRAVDGVSFTAAPGRLTGIVGLPVIRALGSIAVSASGVVHILSESSRRQGEPNVFFDGLTPIAEVHHAGRAMPMTLDTGGTTTYLYSAFREALTAEERAKLAARFRFEIVGNLKLHVMPRHRLVDGDLHQPVAVVFPEF